MAPHFWLWAFVIIAAALVIYFRVEAGKIEEHKGRVMAKQRAIAAELGPKILPFRDRIEGWVTELAGAYPGDRVSPAASLAQIREEPGVYLRMRIEQAKEPRSIRKAATESLHDGFVSCMFVRAGEGDPSKGPPCRAPRDCEPGLLCNEFGVCVSPPRPFNMRLAYRALRVLSSEWTDELHQAKSELAITAYERDLDSVTHNDIPVAAQILASAKFVTIVLDEDPPAGMPEDITSLEETPAERVQRVPHPARVGVFRLADGEQMLRLRTEASGRIVPMAGSKVPTPETRAALDRQAHSCALALEVKQALERAKP